MLEPVHCHREFIIELAAQSQMISIRIVKLLIIRIRVRMSSSYKLGQVIEKDIKNRGHKTQPCSTSLLVNSHDDTVSSTETCCNLF